MKTYEILIRKERTDTKTATGVLVRGANRREAMQKVTGRYVDMFVSLLGFKLFFKKLTFHVTYAVHKAITIMNADRFIFYSAFC